MMRSPPPATKPSASQLPVSRVMVLPEKVALMTIGGSVPVPPMGWRVTGTPLMLLISVCPSVSSEIVTSPTGLRLSRSAYVSVSPGATSVEPLLGTTMMLAVSSSSTSTASAWSAKVNALSVVAVPRLKVTTVLPGASVVVSCLAFRTMRTGELQLAVVNVIVLAVALNRLSPLDSTISESLSTSWTTTILPAAGALVSWMVTSSLIATEPSPSRTELRVSSVDVPGSTSMTTTPGRSLSRTSASTLRTVTWSKAGSAEPVLWLIATTRSPSPSWSSTAVTLTVCATFQLAVVKTSTIARRAGPPPVETSSVSPPDCSSCSRAEAAETVT